MDVYRMKAVNQSSVLVRPDKLKANYAFYRYLAQEIKKREEFQLVIEVSVNQQKVKPANR